MKNPLIRYFYQLYPSRVKIAPFYPAGSAIFNRGHFLPDGCFNSERRVHFYLPLT
jgi:hypothetical protein